MKRYKDIRHNFQFSIEEARLMAAAIVIRMKDDAKYPMTLHERSVMADLVKYLRKRWHRLDRWGS